MRVLYRDIVEREHAMKGLNDQLDLRRESMFVIFCGLIIANHGICHD